jgi:hypothetical protein
VSNSSTLAELLRALRDLDPQEISYADALALREVAERLTAESGRARWTLEAGDFS